MYMYIITCTEDEVIDMYMYMYVELHCNNISIGLLI